MLYKIFPAYLLLSPFTFYLDLLLDALLWAEYYTKAQEGERLKLGVLILSVTFFLLSVAITCLFDFITTMVTKRDRASHERRLALFKKCMLNITQFRANSDQHIATYSRLLTVPSCFG